jgi:hypothetical protein
MTGFAETKDFATALAKLLELEQTKAEAIASDVNELLFTKIRDAMKNISNQGAPMPTTSPVPVTSTPAVSAASTPPTPAPKPQVPLAPHPHDLMLVEKTITTPPNPAKTPSVAPPAPPKPENYKTDPYREPVEP